MNKQGNWLQTGFMFNKSLSDENVVETILVFEPKHVF